MTAISVSEQSRRGHWSRQRLVTIAVWVLVACWALWALMRLFGLERGFPLVPLVAFTPWVGLASLLPLAAALLTRRWRAAISACVVAAIFALLVVPRGFGGPTEAAGGTATTLRVLAANVEFGQTEPEELLALARDLDVDALSLEELTPRFADALAEAGIDGLLPEQVLAPSADANGGGLYSNRRLGATSTELLPGGFALPRGTLKAPGALPIELVSVHTNPPTDWAVEGWKEDLAVLPRPSDAVARVLLGDFNATVDHEAFRDLLDAGYADAAETLGEGFAPTWPVGRRLLPPSVAIDHVLADARIGISEFSVHDVDDSDHRAVFAELLLPTAD